MWITGEVRRAIVVHMFDVGVFGLIVSLLGWPCRYFSGAHLRLGRGVASLRGVSAGRFIGWTAVLFCWDVNCAPEVGRGLLRVPD